MADWGYPRRRRPPTNPQDACEGCHQCGLRCTAGVQMAEDEFARIVDHLKTCDPGKALRVLEQDKTVAWFEDITVQGCLFCDVVRGSCLVYPVRPLVCRLFGRVEWLPCPLGKRLSQVHGGVDLMQTYARQRRATFQEWCAERGIFDFRKLISTTAP